MNTTNVENNPGPASMIIVSGEKDLELACGVIMGEGDVLKNPLNITDASVHTCEFDEEKKTARRKYDGKVQKANFDIMKLARDTRESEGRKIEEVPEMPKITGEFEGTIASNGEIIRQIADNER